MTPDQAKAVAELVGQQLQNEWMTTYKVLAAIPEGSKDYKPEPNSRARMGAGDAPGQRRRVVSRRRAQRQVRRPDQRAIRRRRRVAELGDWYKKKFPKPLEKVLALDGVKLTQIVDFFGMKMPAVQYLLFALVHMVHHRGQLASYLRPMGGKVPSIYGGSYDEPWQGSARPSGTSSRPLDVGCQRL